MDPHQPNEENSSSGGGGGGGGGSKGSFLCRQSSTRWTPTTDQIRILKDLYYNSGVRSPSAEQIQRISARLRQYGKIEGKNVFYWFQNHKARERQKKRFTSDFPMQQQQQLKTSSSNWKPDQDFSFHSKCSNITTPGFSCSSSASPSSTCGFSNVGQMGNYGYGSLTMEKSFRECSISAGGSMSSNYGWVGVDPYNASSNYSFCDKQKSINIFDQTLLEDDQEQDQEQEQEGVPEIETLPLFPTQREDINGFCNIKHNQAICYSHNWYGSEHDGNNTSYRTSLELSLNSYSTRQAPDSI